MKINVQVKPGAKGGDRVIPCADGSLVVRTGAKAHDGEANAAMAKLLAEHFGVAKGRIKVIRGAKSRNKVVEVDFNGNKK